MREIRIDEFRSLDFPSDLKDDLKDILLSLEFHGAAGICPCYGHEFDCEGICLTLFPEMKEYLSDECPCNSIDLEVKIERLKEYFEMNKS